MILSNSGSRIFSVPCNLIPSTCNADRHVYTTTIWGQDLYIDTYKDRHRATARAAAVTATDITTLCHRPIKIHHLESSTSQNRQKSNLEST